MIAVSSAEATLLPASPRKSAIDSVTNEEACAFIWLLFHPGFCWRRHSSHTMRATVGLPEDQSPSRELLPKGRNPLNKILLVRNADHSIPTISQTTALLRRSSCEANSLDFLK